MARWSMVVAGARRRVRSAGDAHRICGERGRADPAGPGGDARRQAGGDLGGVATRLAAGSGRGRPRSRGRPGAAPALRRRCRAGTVDHRQRRCRVRPQRGDRVLRSGARYALDGGPNLLAGRRNGCARQTRAAGGLSGERTAAGELSRCRGASPANELLRGAEERRRQQLLRRSGRYERRDRVGDRHSRRRVAGGRAASRPAGGHGWKSPGGDLPRRPAGRRLRFRRAGLTDLRDLAGQRARGGERRSAGRAGGLSRRVAGGRCGDRLPASVRRRRKFAQPDGAARHADRHRRVLVARRAGDGRDRSDPPDRARHQRGGRRVALHGHGEHAWGDLLAGALRLHRLRLSSRRRRWPPAVRPAGRSRAPARW